MKMKKVLLGTVALAAVGILASCGSKSTNNGGSVDEFSNLANLSIVSGTSLLSDSNNNVKKARLSEESSVETTPEVASNETDESTKEMILKNLKLAENTLSNGVSQSELKYSDNENYEYEYTITATTLLGETEIYTFLFNAEGELDLLINGNEKDKSADQTMNKLFNDDDDDEDDDDDDDDDDDEDEDDDDDKDEIDVKFEGIVLLDDNEYNVSGKYEAEDDEIEYQFEISLENGDYVKIKTEAEDDETEYKYESYIDGVKSEYKVEYEFDDDEQEIKFEQEIDGIETEYKYEFFKKDNKSYVKVKFEKENKNAKDFEEKYLIEIVDNGDGTVSYNFVY